MAALPQPWKSLAARIYKLEEAQRRQRNASPFSGTPFRPREDGGINSTNFDGDLNGGDPGTQGWAMDDNQAAFGQLLLRDGIVGNAALTNPVVPAVVHAQSDSFTVPTTNTARATATVPVPTGYTRAIVTAHAHASCFNPNAGADYLYVVAWIQSDTTIGWSMPVTIGPNVSATTSQTATALITGLSGSFTVKVALSCQNTAFTTSLTGNVCNIDATVLFLR